ncbi:MAG TPA: hypothetical protein DHW82_09030 [Spirochaetia bacterium]|nr:MAG: hypothetical protein A2Y41_06270 [Spirochaetes bacterium GWB1_36_13]HCL57132.1 hypothetical protein [Spirochaetia bacterium]
MSCLVFMNDRIKFIELWKRKMETKLETDQCEPPDGAFLVLMFFYSVFYNPVWIINKIISLLHFNFKIQRGNI